MNFLSKLIVSSLAVMITAYLLKGVQIDSVFTAILVAAVLSLLNSIVKPILVILTIPITILTLGVFLLIINAAMILLAGEIVTGFKVDGFWTAFFFSIILSFINAVFHGLARKENDTRE